MFPSLNFITIFWGFLLGIFWLLLYSFIISPILTMLYYKRQGGILLFHKELISLPSCYKNAREKGNYFYKYDELLQKHPEAKFLVENFGSKAHVILVDTEMIKEALKKYEIYLRDLSFFSLTKSLMQGSIIFEEGTIWEKRRKYMASAFNFEYLGDLAPMIADSAQQGYSEWVKSGELTDINLIQKFGTITRDIIGKVFFGRKFSEKKLKGLTLTAGLQKLLNDSILECITIPVILFGLKIVKANILPHHRELNNSIKEMRLRCQELIEEAEKGGLKEHTLLKFLLDMHSNMDPKYCLTDDDIIGEFLGEFSAGTEPVADLLGVTIYYLWKYPSVLKKVREEVEREIQDISQITFERVNRMEYVTALIKESMRLAGPTGSLITRFAANDDNLCGLKVKKGTKIAISPPLLYRSDKYFSNPFEFIPERWLSSSNLCDDKYKVDPYSFIPFGAGPRSCLGQNLAILESKLLITLFIKTFDFTFPEDYKLVLGQKFSFQPLDPLKVTIRLKNM